MSLEPDIAFFIYRRLARIFNRNIIYTNKIEAIKIYN